MLLLETGLGGALDSQQRPEKRRLPPSSPRLPKDHEHFLRRLTWVTDIASQKAGIMRTQTPCYSACQQTEVMHVLAAHAKNIGASLQVAGLDFDLAEIDDGGIHVSCAAEDFFLPAPSLRGPHRLRSAISRRHIF